MLSESERSEVDEEIAGHFRSLRFRPALEQQFEADTFDDRCRGMVRINIIGLIVYHGFLISDYTLVRDVFLLDLFVHFGIITPLVLSLNAVIARRPPPWIREGSLMLVILALALSITLMVLASEMPARDLVQFDTVLVVLFTTSLQRLRFRYAVATLGGMLAIYALGLSNLHPLAVERALALLSTFVGILVFSIIGCYNLEHEVRGAYLLRRRDRLRNRDLEAVSLLDPLTTVGNRRALDAALLAVQMDAAAGVTSPTAALLLDIDHFKLFNDTNGHQQGDACLKQVALIVAGAVSTEGVVYRYGGEEFIVVLRDRAIDGAARMAETIRRAVVAAAIPRHQGADAVVTISVGAAAGRIGRDVTPAALIALADSALYTAKRRGRNQVWPTSDREMAGLPLAS